MVEIMHQGSWLVDALASDKNEVMHAINECATPFEANLVISHAARKVSIDPSSKHAFLNATIE